MEQYTTGNGIYKGIYWRYIGLITLALSALEVVAHYALKYPLISSLGLAEVVMVYLVVPRTKERRLTNAILAVVATEVVGIILQLFLGTGELAKYKLSGVVGFDAFSLALGVVAAYLYLRLSIWSDRKRAETDAKRAQNNAKRAGRGSSASTTSLPVRRHHSKKGRKKRKKR